MSRCTHLNGDLVCLLDEVFLLRGLVPLKAFLELLDFIGNASVVGELFIGVNTLLLDGGVGERVLVVQGRHGVRCVGHSESTGGKGPRDRLVLQ